MTVVTVWDNDLQIICRVEEADVEQIGPTEWVCTVGPDVVPRGGIVGLVTIHNDERAVTKPYAIEWQATRTILRVIDASAYLRGCIKWGPCNHLGVCNHS